MKLSDLKAPEQLKSLPVSDLEEIASEVRQVMVDTVSVNGGHLASNLGIVELTLSLYHVFDFSKDKIIFDVGHQCYVHKLLTGRYRSFSTIRQEGGISGFPRREESPYDLFNTGHSSSSLSMAAGMARARDLTGGDHRVVCVVGDGAMTGGMAYEALNDMGNTRTRVIIVLNDNGMSISGNVGALSNYLTYLRLSKGWQQIKGNVSKALLKVPVCGKRLHDLFHNFKDHIRNIFINDKFFSSLGIRYIGPVDGHDIKRLSTVLAKAQNMDEPVLIHVMTQKGRGHEEAEKNPEGFHNLPPKGAAGGKAAGEEVCARLLEEAQKDPKIAVVTAAMTRGTGFASFAKRFPDRLFDVGIAEEHAVTMAAGLAAGGMKPFVAVYDTFFQRAVDQILEDVCCQGLPVTFLSDRAEFAAQDGMTHHGLYGISCFRAVPGLDICTPVCLEELLAMVSRAARGAGPNVIRYPKRFDPLPAAVTGPFEPGKWHVLREGASGSIIASGNMAGEALKAAGLLEEQGISVTVIGANSVRPLDETLLADALRKGPCFTVEEHQISGGFGSAVCEFASLSGLPSPRILALPPRFYPHGDRNSFLETWRLNAVGIARAVGKDVRHEDKG